MNIHESRPVKQFTGITTKKMAVCLHRNAKMAGKSLIFIIFQKGKNIINQHLSAVLLYTGKMLHGHEYKFAPSGMFLTWKRESVVTRIFSRKNG